MRLSPAPLLGLIALTLLTSCHPSRTAELPESPRSALPITRVVLYQNGVGYFEREGVLEGNSLALQVRPSQINDLLKSLTIVDKSDGRALSVSLPLEKSGDRLLSELPEQVRNAGGLLDLLTVLRGARVEVSGTFGSAEGRVVGLENIPQHIKEAVVPRWRLTLSDSEGELTVLAFEQIRTLTILDHALATGLDRSLDVSLNEGDWKPVSITVRFTGDADHPLRASYIVEMPRWKPAYRVVLDGDKPLLQGWAVVDNVSGEDWTNVKLSLVAGTPISFIYDLHSSQFVRRTDLTPLRPTAAPPPPIERGGVVESSADGYAEAEEAMPAAPPASGGAAKRRSAAPMSRPMRGESAPEPEMDVQLQSQFLAQTEIEQVGSLFRYDLQAPVSVPDRSSTLVNIVNQRISAEEVAMFRPEQPGRKLPTHPYRAVRFTNNTPYTLEQGPVTIYSEGTFVGEGFLQRVEPNATHFVGFSVDSKVSLDSDSTRTDGESKLVRITGGVFTTDVQRTETVTYRIKNAHSEPITAFVKESRRSNWRLQNPPRGVVETPDSLWLPLQVPASGDAQLTVAWEQNALRSTTIDTDLNADRLFITLRNTKLPPEIEAVLNTVLAIKREADAARKQITHLNELRETLSSDQERVRNNLDTLRKTKGNAELQRTLSQKLAKLELELGQLSGQLVTQVERRAELAKQLSNLVADLSFEAK